MAKAKQFCKQAIQTALAKHPQGLRFMPLVNELKRSGHTYTLTTILTALQKQVADGTIIGIPEPAGNRRVSRPKGRMVNRYYLTVQAVLAETPTEASP